MIEMDNGVKSDRFNYHPWKVTVKELICINKLTRIFNMKTSLFYAISITTISSFFSPTAQALSLTWAGFPDFFQYDLILNSDAALTSSVGGEAIFSGAIEKLSIFDDVPANSATPNQIISETNLDLNVVNLDLNSGKFSLNTQDIINNFSQVNSRKIVGINTNEPIFEYRVDINQMVDFQRTINGGMTETIPIDYQTFGFVVPSSFLVNGTNINLMNLDTSLKALEGLIGLEIDLPILADATASFDSFEVMPNGLIDSPAGGLKLTETSVPEASTTLSLLLLGIIGVGVTVKTKHII